MHNDFVQDIYNTLCGYLIPEACVTGVENAFAPGKICDLCYEAAAAARDRILQRLGVEEDADLNCIFDELTYIARELGLKMFAYGSCLKKEEKPDQTSVP